MRQDVMFLDSHTERGKVAQMDMAQRIERAVALLREHEPADGYYLAFSGGKDSCVIDALAKLAGVRYEKWYNNTTIDPPELVRFIKRVHPDAKWNNPRGWLKNAQGLVEIRTVNMMHRVATAPKVAPTRMGRWCCEEYKEGGGKGRVKVFGVRAAESRGRARRWSEWAKDQNGDPVACPIVFWTDVHVWEFIRATDTPHCSLYDEGFTRLGCVDCPLASLDKREKERARWPKMAENWKRAVIANWERWKDIPNTRTGKARMQADFPTGEDYYLWWSTGHSGRDVFRDDCQAMILWTNEDEA